MSSIIEVKNATYTYDGADVPAISDISFKIQSQTWVSIVGTNGSGKSTLAKLLNGLENIDSGEIYIDNQQLTEANLAQIRRNIGIIFQNPDHQFVGATVEDDVAFGLENIAMPREQMIERVQWALEQVKMLKFANKAPQTLSGGQKQRVAIAGIIALKPKIIIMDESTSMLDPQGRQDILEIMHDLQKSLGVTILSITHDMSEVIQSDQIIVLQKGKIVREGGVEQIFAEPDELAQFGLQPPFTQQIQTQLIQKGVNLPANYLTKQGLVNHLWQLYSKM